VAGANFPLLIKSLLTTPLQRAPDQQIISDGLGSYSYRDFNRRLNQFGSMLAGMDLATGAVVAVLDWDTHRYLECFFAVPMYGAVLHTVNIRLSPAQIAYTINHAEDDVILVHVDFLDLLESVMPMVDRDLRIIVMSDNADDEIPETGLDIDGNFERLLAAGDPDFAFPDFDENLRATVFYTTGTTGDPKAVAYTHRQLVLHTMGILGGVGASASTGRFHDGDVYMPITPMFHVHGWGFPYAATLLGVKQVYPGRYVPARLLRLIDQEGVSFSHCVPTILHMLLSAPEAAIVDFAKWKVVIGGSALPRGLCETALSLGINIFAAYGLSETCPFLTIAHLNPLDEADVGPRLKAGRPVPMVDLRIVDEAMQDVPPVDKSGNRLTGEIVVRAPWMNAEYLKDDAATKDLWRGGYLHTGDVGYLDETGALIITDRMKDVIKSGGEWISSLSLESIASAVDGVGEVAVIGVPDAKWGERPLLIIVPATGVVITDVRASIKAAFSAQIEANQISKWAYPDHIEFVDVIAKTSVGKIDKKRLRFEFSDKLA